MEQSPRPVLQQLYIAQVVAWMRWKKVASRLPLPPAHAGSLRRSDPQVDAQYRQEYELGQAMYSAQIKYLDAFKAESDPVQKRSYAPFEHLDDLLAAYEDADLPTVLEWLRASNPEVKADLEDALAKGRYVMRRGVLLRGAP